MEGRAETERLLADEGSTVSAESSATRSSTLKAENFRKSFETDDRASFVIDYNNRESGVSLVFSRNFKDDIDCERDSSPMDDSDCKNDSSTMEFEDSTIFLETDNEASLDIDYDHTDAEVRLEVSSAPKRRMRCSFDTSNTTIDDSARNTTLIDDSERGRSLQIPEIDIENTESDYSRRAQRAQIIPDDDNERTESGHSPEFRSSQIILGGEKKTFDSDLCRESQRSEGILGDDNNTPKSNHLRQYSKSNIISSNKMNASESNHLRQSQSSKTLPGDANKFIQSNHSRKPRRWKVMPRNCIERETFHRPERLPSCQRKVLNKSKSLRSFMPSRNPLIEDDTESTNSDLSRVSMEFRYRKKGDGKFKSSLDLIYGDGAATPHYSAGSLGSSSQRQSDNSDRRSDFAISRNKKQNKKFRISKNPIEMKVLRIEAFCYNRGMEIAMGVLYFALNYLVAAHGAYQFTEAGGWTTDDEILKITLPIARAGGRLVTLNCALLLLTACKYLWTVVRAHIAPVIPIGFPIDDVMPKYHRYVALTVIVSGCIIHTLPQIVNYVTKSLSIDNEEMKLWTFWDAELATKQLLLSGTLLALIFSTFYLTTLKAFRKTAAGFRWFWFFHVGGIATAYPLLIIHGTYRGNPVFLYAASLPLLLYIFDICMRRSKISKAKIIRWETHEDEGQEITELIVECPPNFEYTPGQYVGLKIPKISAREWHPFTIASAPNEKACGKDGKKQLVFYIKNQGRWTEALYEYASAFDLSKAKKIPKIYIQGPYGAPAMNYFEYKHILVIGSGVGAAPLLSIWKYLVAKGMSIAEVKKRKVIRPSVEKAVMDATENTFLSEQTPDLEGGDEDIAFGESLDIASAKGHSTIRGDCIFLQTILESMTISLVLFAIFVLGETLTIVLQLFGSVSVANTIGYSLSIFALVVHGTTIIVSTIAMGWRVYCKNFRCWLEVSIVFLDSIALWFAVRSTLRHPEQTEHLLQNEMQNEREDIIIYFTIFTYVVILHAIRIFHMFYVALKPAAAPNKMTKKKKANLPTAPSNKEEIYSVEGILINRKYSSMRFAAKDLLPPIVENGLSDLYSMEFYGTREKETEEEKQDLLISDMMGASDGSRGSKKELSDIRASLLQNNQNKYFCAGRPDWNRVFLKSIARAHCTNEEGESVGVFFCGSPAIAKDLQAEAKRVTAQHQFAMKQLDGKPCKCKIMVHVENF